MTRRIRPAPRARVWPSGGNVTMWQNPKPDENTTQIYIGTPSLGLIRIEWSNAMESMSKPPNWAMARSTPIGYPVGPAQNMIADGFLRGPYRALLLIEDDTVPPADALLRFDRWFFKMERKMAPPVVSGCYHIKGA